MIILTIFLLSCILVTVFLLAKNNFDATNSKPSQEISSVVTEDEDSWKDKINWDYVEKGVSPPNGDDEILLTRDSFA